MQDQNPVGQPVVAVPFFAYEYVGNGSSVIVMANTPDGAMVEAQCASGEKELTLVRVCDARLYPFVCGGRR